MASQRRISLHCGTGGPIGLGLVAVLWLGCGGATGSTPPAAKTAPRLQMSADIALLDAPAPRVPEQARQVLAALERLATRAERGDEDGLIAAWARAHYLLDVFDEARFGGGEARFGGDDDSRALLLAALATPALTAPAETRAARQTRTNAVIDALAVAVDAILAQDRLHPGALAARALLAYDRQRGQPAPTAAAARWQQFVPIRRIAHSGSALAANARMRLFFYCRQILAEAAERPRAERDRLLPHCLYSLQDADPGPYFAAPVSSRPPPPQALPLANALELLLAPVAEGDGRLARAARVARAELTAAMPTLTAAMPPPPDPATLGLPRITNAAPYTGQPLFALDATVAAAVPEAIFADLTAPGGANRGTEALTRALARDGRGQACVVLGSDAPAERLLEAAALIRRAGAQRLCVLAWMHQQVQVAAGDYWSQRLPPDQRIRRLARIELTPRGPLPAPGVASGTAPDDAAAENAGTSPTAAEATGDAPAEALGLALVLDATSWRLVSPTGELGSFATAADPQRALRAVVADVARAFPGPHRVALVPSPGATVGAIASAAETLTTHVDGQPAPDRRPLALSARAPDVRAQTLAVRVARRAAATTTVAPAELGSAQPTLRRCYQDALERLPRLAGTLRLARRGERLRVVSGPPQPALRRCVQATLDEPMRRADIGVAEVTLAPR